MSQFITRTFGAGNDIALQLGSEEWVRKLAISNAWNQIRIGVLVAINPLTGSPSTAPSLGSGLAIGMCSGLTNPYGAASTTNAIGISFGLFGSGWSYAPNSGNPVFAMNGGNYEYSRVGASTSATTLGGGYNTIVPVVGQGTVMRRDIIIVDITKGSPNYTLFLYNTASNSGPPASQIDYTPTDLKQAVLQPGTPSVQGFPMDAHGSFLLAASESPGILDTVNVYSTLNAFPLELYEVAIEKMA